MNLPDAKKILDRAAKIYYKNKYIDCINEIKKIDGASDLFSRKLYLNFLHLKGDVLYDLGRYGESESIYLKIISIRKTDVAYANVAIAQWERGKYKEALQNYLKAVKLNPSNAVANRGVGEMYLKLKKQKRAIPYLAKSVKLDPRYSEAYVALGVAHYQTSSWAESYKALHKALKINPKEPLAKKGIKKIETLFSLK